MSQLGGAPLCTICDKRVYYNEERTFMGNKYHQRCFKCSSCGKALESGTANWHEALVCNACQRTLAAAARRDSVKSEGGGEAGGRRFSQTAADSCPRCGRPVYFAEQIIGVGRKWHKLCYTCASCHKKVDSQSQRDHDGELYCKSCHARQFGPKGYGFAGGAGTMLSMDTGKRNEVTRQNVPQNLEYVAGDNGAKPSTVTAPRFGGGDYCPRCNKQVFIAEKKLAAGNVYHKSCFTCNQCRKMLDSGSLTEHEYEIYCKACYGKRFGPKGYGYGAGSGVLQQVS